jgi:concanavalin A-like lectin/glucanase superfamily protein
MRMRTVIALWLSLAAAGCGGSAPPTQPTSSISGGSGLKVQTTAQSRGNPDATHLCYQGGYLKVVRADGTGFNNVGECVSYAAQGGTFGGGAVCAGVPGGIISWWPGDGNAQDIVGHYDGTLQAGATFGTGMVGQAFSLDGIDDAIVVNNNAALNPTSITVEAWVKPNIVPALADVVTKWGFDATIDSYFLGLLNSGGAVVVVGAIGDGATGDSGFSGGTVTLSAWNHIAMTYDAASGVNRLYLNGVSVSQRVRANGIYPTTSRVFIGREDSTNNRFFNGLIDEPTVYSRALADAEILAIYNAGGNGKCKASS